MCVSLPVVRETRCFTNELEETLSVCHRIAATIFRVGARQRIGIMLDPDTRLLSSTAMSSTNILRFPEYEKKPKSRGREQGEAVVCGTGRIGGFSVAVFVMDHLFMMGSMGTVVGEDPRIFEYATEHPCRWSGSRSRAARGCRRASSRSADGQTSAAVKRHSDAGNLYITVITDPTSGGVTASFAMEATSSSPSRRRSSGSRA